jgi:hypothetical protein
MPFRIMKSIYLILLFPCIVFLSCNNVDTERASDGWNVSVLPPSVRIDPVTNKIIDQHFCILENNGKPHEDLLKRNHLYDGKQVSLFAARGEYISWQLVITNNGSRTIKNIMVEMPEFNNDEVKIGIKPEFFLEWSVEVKTPSTGYPEASLGTGWYPDALIPFRYIQYDSSAVRHRWTYPL